MEVLRKYIVNDSEMNGLIGNNIFFVDKPEKVKSDNYIIYKYKELNGGYIKDYSVELNVIGKDLSKLIKVKERLIELIDDPQNTKTIKDNNMTIRTSHLVNGGGITKNPETGNYHVVIFFTVKI